MAITKPEFEKIASIDAYKSWVQSFPVGHKIFRDEQAFVVQSAGIDFLILKSMSDNRMVRVSRNTVESLAFTPRLQP